MRKTFTVLNYMRNIYSTKLYAKHLQYQIICETFIVPNYMRNIYSAKLYAKNLHYETFPACKVYAKHFQYKTMGV